MTGVRLPVAAGDEMGRVYPRHIPTLDGVRGLAAATVVISHSASLGLLPIFLGDRFGQQAVLLFFILSGFLMYHLYGERPFQPGEVLRYFTHRIGRVVPLFYLIVMLCWLLPATGVAIWVFPIETAAVLREHLFFVRGVSALWTVPVEIQFYVVFLVLWMCQARGRFLLGVVSVQVLALMVAACQYVCPIEVGLLPQTIQFFLAGALIGFLLHRNRMPDRLILRYGKWLLAAILLFTVFSSSLVRQYLKLHMAPTWWDPVLAGLPLLIFVAALNSVPPFNLLATAPFRWLGRISYGVYIFHFPVVVTLSRYMAPESVLGKLGTVLLICAVTLLIAAASYVMFESPLRKMIALKRRPASARDVAP